MNAGATYSGPATLAARVHTFKSSDWWKAFSYAPDSAQPVPRQVKLLLSMPAPEGYSPRAQPKYATLPFAPRIQLVVPERAV